MNTPVRTVATPPPYTALKGRVIGFATNKANIPLLRGYGIRDKDIYLAGRGAESLDEAFRRLRCEPGNFVLAEDASAFGKTKGEVFKRVEQLEQTQVRIIDLTHPEDQTYAAVQQRAHQRIAGSRFQDKRAARRTGRLGGIGKQLASIARRHADMADKYIRRICNHKALSWPVRVEILEGIASEATLRRHYYDPEGKQ